MRYERNQPAVITYGCFEYPSTMLLPERYVRLEQDMANLLDEHKPEAVAVETLIFNKNITTAMQVAEARGVIVLSAAKRGIVVQNCTPLQVKMTITGYGRADKKQMLEMVKRQLDLRSTHKLDDAIDALGIAMTGYHLILTGKRLTK